MVRIVAAGSLGVAALAVVAAEPAGAATSTVRLYKVVYDPSGSDTHANSQLNREYVVLKNGGKKTVKLTGWTVRDTKKHVYTFGTFSLKPGKYVYIHTGHGTNTSANVYQNKGWYVWNNTADKVSLRTAAGTSAGTCSWKHTKSGYKVC
ncbi:lamin tail domain-containing protein [Actinomadura sp. DC4]|uniref:lamin tail domain-containing protein n=1 Tax=Actinomadura sp. DC4 TaxID=3055069 RepID=UPI0025B23861|nr:lamin tail domain-containing protein [Actinomadura sp. DC4]MDN3351274.1 lamin tail domain-containing protein [Actinomadura sp. DC4]